MKIRPQTVVAITYTLKDDDGKVIDSNVDKEPLLYLHGAGNVVPGLEKALDGKDAGDLIEVSIPPSEGYGEYDETRIFEVPKSELGANVTPQKGMMLNMRGPGGMQMPVRVQKVKLRTVVMDANHQLCGKTLHFSVKVESVRKARKGEIAHRHAHGKGGHGHAH